MAKKSANSKTNAKSDDSKKSQAGSESGKESAEAINEIGFENLIQRLEETVRELEDGDLGLQEALEKYESGVKDLKNCYELLRNAEQKIELLVAIDENGEVQTEAFDGNATDRPKLG